MDKTYRITRQQLYDLVWSRSMNALAAEFGISGNGLAKICDRLLIPHPPRGYWSGNSGGRKAVRAPLPARPEDCDADVVISSRRAPSRRGRTRLSHTARRDQIVEAASKIIVKDGVLSATMKTIAREVGISEALMYNYFPSHADLLTFIARLEQEEMSKCQQAEIDKHQDYIGQVRGSQAGYLDYVAIKGGLLQALLGSAEVRNALRLEHQGRRAWSTAASSSRMTDSLGVSPAFAVPGSQVMRALGVRSGKLLASQKVDRSTAGRLAAAIMDGARSRLIRMARPEEVQTGHQPRRAPSRGKVRARGRDPVV